MYREDVESIVQISLTKKSRLQKNLFNMSGIEYRFLFRTAAILTKLLHLPDIFKFIVNLRFYAAYEFGKDSINFILHSSVFSSIKSAPCLQFA
jgi:hypothetical protein